MQTIQDTYTSIINSEFYKIKVSKESYLSHICIILPGDFNPEKDSVDNYDMQYGFYNKDTHKVDTITMGKKGISISESEDPLSKETLEAIDLDKAKVSFTEIYATLKNLIKEKYKGNIPLKTFAILQFANDLVIWNITILRSDFKTLNVKLNAETGAIIEDSLKELIKFDK